MRRYFGGSARASCVVCDTCLYSSIASNQTARLRLDQEKSREYANGQLGHDLVEEPRHTPAKVGLGLGFRSSPRSCSTSKLLPAYTHIDALAARAPVLHGLSKHVLVFWRRVFGSESLGEPGQLNSQFHAICPVVVSKSCPSWSRSPTKLFCGDGSKTVPNVSLYTRRVYCALQPT